MCNWSSLPTNFKKKGQFADTFLERAFPAIQKAYNGYSKETNSEIKDLKDIPKGIKNRTASGNKQKITMDTRNIKNTSKKPCLVWFEGHKLIQTVKQVLVHDLLSMLPNSE